MEWSAASGAASMFRCSMLRKLRFCWLANSSILETGGGGVTETSDRSLDASLCCVIASGDAVVAVRTRFASRASQGSHNTWLALHITALRGGQRGDSDGGACCPAAWLHTALFLKEINAFFIGGKEDRRAQNGAVIGGRARVWNRPHGCKTALPPPDSYYRSIHETQSCSKSCSRAGNRPLVGDAAQIELLTPILTCNIQKAFSTGVADGLQPLCRDGFRHPA
ncbi:hypothetical protein TcasGA2_TC013615 [Tribolium castaneum]|uniref:Uncharacterized protein n=1 Tax=Tribolium castaneum TaxID=7070 RepID=D6W6Z8_TRICA|nr:hypothetical protein TcasGA2_TC013615 [Tribolium castaneum]